MFHYLTDTHEVSIAYRRRHVQTCMCRWRALRAAWTRWCRVLAEKRPHRRQTVSISSASCNSVAWPSSGTLPGWTPAVAAPRPWSTPSHDGRCDTFEAGSRTCGRRHFFEWRPGPRVEIGQVHPEQSDNKKCNIYIYIYIYIWDM